MMTAGDGRGILKLNVDADRLMGRDQRIAVSQPWEVM